ncbi:MAG: hypothetical protein PVI03_01330 [Candidatus Thorarchaeota archaeon]
MKWSDFAKYALAGILVVGLLLSVPYKRVEQKTSTYEITPQSWHNVSLVFGGPMITLVTVEMNRTSTIRFMYPDGVWPRNVLLVSFTGTIAMYNYRGAHYTIAIEVDSRGPIWIRVRYVYAEETESRFIDDPLGWLNPFIFPGPTIAP